jgi:hypothetical protein
MTALLYKFVASIVAVENILAGKLKFATIPQLNDPNEMMPDMNFEAVAASRRELMQTGFSDYQFIWLQRQVALLQRLAPTMQAIPVPADKHAANEQLKKSFYNNLTLMEHFHRETVNLVPVTMLRKK